MTLLGLYKNSDFKKNCKRSFTFTETMVVVVVLSVITTLTLPGVIRKHYLTVNRLKLQKAVITYKSILSKMIFENGLRTNGDLTAFGGNSCNETSKYFSKSKIISESCKFKTPDGLYWDITNISKPIIAFDEKNLSLDVAKEDSYKAFELFGGINNRGMISVNEFNSELSESDNEALTKVYNFLLNK